MQQVKNVKAGLRSRTKIINRLEVNSNTAIILTNITSMSYSAILHHLRLLEREGLVKRTGKRPFNWQITGIGQKQLVP